MSSGKSQVQLLEEISSKLDSLIAVLAVRGLEGDTAAMTDKLHSMGFAKEVIAPVVGLTENAVRVRIQRARKKTPRSK